MTPDEFRAGLDKLGWKQSDFAMATGLSKVAVSNWLNATATPLPLWAQSHLALLLKLHDLAGELLTPPTKAAKAARDKTISI
ncbi:helix-turn-helix domain-containing protein [Methylobacillus flagellatus]|uniref:helix-turn-helix domain-containing protein n=1 Tax=Methylobacillus flagellatus TaxID=405 RepID=UPI0010F93A3D|nr:helix-turn-helix transcriptional regulator [Methylobacillus flagellatus]